MKPSLLSKFCILLFGMALLQSLNAQSSKIMTPEVYSIWTKIKDVKISDSANTIIYTLEREIGDKSLLVYSSEKKETKKFKKVEKVEIDITGRFVVFTHGLADDSLKILKRLKTDKKKFPKDSLTIYDSFDGKQVTFPNVKSFKMAKEYGGFVVMNLEIEETKTDTTKTDKKPKNPCITDMMIVRNLYDEKNDTFLNVKDFYLSDDHPKLVFSQCTGDSIAKFNVLSYNLNTNVLQGVYENLAEVGNFSIDKLGKKISFLGLEEESKKTKKPFNLYLYDVDSNKGSQIAGLNSSFLKPGYLISNDKTPVFSEKSNRLIFGISPFALEKDTLKLEDEIVNVEIWKHDTPLLFTQMESTKEQDEKKTYDIVYDLRTSTFTELENVEFDRSVISQKGDGRYVLKVRTLPYQTEITWLGYAKKDIFLFDLNQRKETEVAIAQSDQPDFSPQGKFIYWYNKPDSIWKAFDVNSLKQISLGTKTMTAFYDEEHDTPDLPGAYGIAGWMDDDRSVLVYDRYDIWKIIPGDHNSAIRLTNGRKDKTRYRYIKLDDEQTSINPSEELLLLAFNEITKEEHYASYNNNSGIIKILYGGKYSLMSRPKQARKTKEILFSKENFDLFPDLLLSDLSFEKVSKISDANPQQSEYAWGSGSLYSWKNYDGNTSNGMVFYPPNFDKTKKYPLIVNFYEKSSDGIYSHRAPAAHRSSINYTYYTNLGYIIFNPDILYRTGYPGDDCYNALNSGVDALIKTGYIDSTNMALQGHSWGGYQVAYLLTLTDRFKCAESGAPVVNMVSAYGGIRWESGMSRMFQYERTQSRLGVTLWDNPKLYHHNSPIYKMDKVNTPVLILHNDHDGAVPWYQGIEYFMALRRLGKKAWMLNYNGEPHWPVKWQNRLDFNIRMEQFFNHYLMDAPLPLWMKEGNTPSEKGIKDKLEFYGH